MITTDPESGTPLRLLAIHRYFWPDTPPYASMLRAITARWASDGHDVSVFSTQPSYKQGVTISRRPPRELVDGIEIVRLDLPSEHGRPAIRILNVIRFAFGIVLEAWRRRPLDVIMISTVPPVIGAAAARFASAIAGARLIYHCMDVHPELGKLSGDFSNPLLYSALRAIDGWTCRGAARVVVLSRDMEQAIRARKGGANLSVAVINNFDIPELGESPEVGMQEVEKPPGRFRLLFAGNVGRFQGLETVIDAMARINAGIDAELLIVGGGKAVADLRARSRDLPRDRVRFVSHQPVAAVRAIIRTADVCLVTLRPGVSRYAYPSKTMTYLSEGAPLIVMAEPESEFAKFVTEQGVGLVVTPGDARLFAETIEYVHGAPKLRETMSTRARETARRHFAANVVLGRWSALVSEIGLENSGG